MHVVKPGRWHRMPTCCGCVASAGARARMNGVESGAESPRATSLARPSCATTATCGRGCGSCCGCRACGCSSSRPSAAPCHRPCLCGGTSGLGRLGWTCDPGGSTAPYAAECPSPRPRVPADRLRALQRPQAPLHPLCYQQLGLRHQPACCCSRLALRQARPASLRPAHRRPWQRARRPGQPETAKGSKR